MISPIASAILITWSRNRDYARSLVSDLAPDQFIAQPVPGVTMNHPAWILSHLNVYAPIAAALLREKPFEDPIDHRYGRKSRVVNDPAEYPRPDRLLTDYLRLHDEAQVALETAPESRFAEPNPLARWQGMHPRIGDQLATLCIKHESMHLGQLSAWRRAMGLPPVAM